jgi:hypothetical protein
MSPISNLREVRNASSRDKRHDEYRCTGGHGWNAGHRFLLPDKLGVNLDLE